MTDAVPTISTVDLETLKRRATYAAVAVASILIVIKLIAWAYSGSVSLLASLIDSGLDLLASGLNLFAVRHALEPADKEHRFGHGKAEAIAGLGQAAFIGGARWVSPAVQLYREGLEAAYASEARTVRLIGPRELTPTTRLEQSWHS